MTLGAAEVETIIRWNQEEKVAHLYTCQRGIWRKVERYGYKATREFREKEGGRVYAKEFDLPLSCVSLRRGNVKVRPEPTEIEPPGPRRTLSEAHKAAMMAGRERKRLKSNLEELEPVVGSDPSRTD